MMLQENGNFRVPLSILSGQIVIVVLMDIASLMALFHDNIVLLYCKLALGFFLGAGCLLERMMFIRKNGHGTMKRLWFNLSGGCGDAFQREVQKLLAKAVFIVGGGTFFLVLNGGGPFVVQDAASVFVTLTISGGGCPLLIALFQTKSLEAEFGRC